MTSLRTAKRFIFPLLGLWAILYASITLVQPPLLDGQDALSAEIAREMLTGGHWVTPYANGIRYAQHPPLLYWTVAASFRLFGVSDWAARLPLALAALFLFIATFSLGRRLYRAKNAAFYSALALITSYGVFLFSRLLLRDVFLCLWVTLAINFFVRSLSQERHRLESALGFAACCGLGVLTEGIAGVVFPVVIVILYLIGARRVNHVLRWHTIPAVLLFLAIVLPEHIAAGIAIGHAPVGMLMPAMTGGRVPLWVFWPLLLLWIIPWCAFSLRALRTCDSSTPDLRCQARMLCVIWILVVLIGFSFTARLEYNLITALPPMALLAGGWLADDEALPHHHGRIASWILFVIGMAAAALCAYYLFTSPAVGSGVDIATLLSPGAAHHPVFFTYFLNLTHRAMGAFRVPLAITLAALLVGVTAGLIFRLRDNARMANCFLAGMIVAILIAAHLALVTFSPVLSSQILANAIKPEVQPSDVIVVNDTFESASSFVFYLERQVLVVTGPGSTPPTSGSPFIGNAQLATLWNGQNRVWLWTHPDNVPALPAPVYVIGRSGGKEVLSNEPNAGGASF